MRSTLSRVALFSTLSLSAFGCGGSDDTDDLPQTIELPAEITASAVANYSAIVLASYQDSLTAAGDLDTALSAMLAEPSDTNLEAARQAWLDAREPYLQTEVYRFYDGPIDNPDDGPEGLLNAWPMDENYVDYVQDNPTAGVINDAAVAIDATTLEGLNEQGGEKNIATGYHAIEFLLWGQDLSADGPGDRPFTDFVSDGSGTADNQIRRGEYLGVVSAMMIANLQSLVAAWSPGVGTYRAEFESVDAKEAFTRILTGMIVLSGFETGGERLQTALDSGDQEDEHSCFSDNTHRDMVQDTVGVQNVWRGSYTRIDGTTVSGTGVRDVVAAFDQVLADQIDTRIDASVAAANALQPPFDREIALDNAAGRARVETLIKSLRDQESLLEEVFIKLGLAVPQPE